MRPVMSELRVYEGEAAVAVGVARSRVTSRRGCLLTLTDGDGVVGQGEASPLPGYSRETLDEVLAALDGVHARFEEAALHEPLMALDAPWVRALPGAARFALETALLDLVGKRRSVALHALLGASAGRVEVSAYAGAALDAGLVDAVRAALDRGLSVVKVKLSGADDVFEEELDALKALRQTLGESWELRLDLNGAWDVERALERLPRLGEVSPRFVEQPVPPGQLRALGEHLKRWSHRGQWVHWAIDESLVDEGDTGYVMASGNNCGCAAAVLKPAVLGLLGARRLAQRAHGAGLGLVVTHLFDGPVALAAACELALALPAPQACGLDLHPGLAAWPPVKIIQREDPCYVTASGRPGLGLDPLPRSPR